MVLQPGHPPPPAARGLTTSPYLCLAGQPTAVAFLGPRAFGLQTNRCLPRTKARTDPFGQPRRSQRTPSPSKVHFVCYARGPGAGAGGASDSGLRAQSTDLPEHWGEALLVQVLQRLAVGPVEVQDQGDVRKEGETSSHACGLVIGVVVRVHVGVVAVVGPRAFRWREVMVVVGALAFRGWGRVALRTASGLEHEGQRDRAGQDETETQKVREIETERKRQRRGRAGEANGEKECGRGRESEREAERGGGARRLE